MMEALEKRAAAIVDARVAARIAALAEVEPPAGLVREPIADGVAFRGPRLAWRLAFDGGLRGWFL